MHDFFEKIDERQHRKYRLDHHALVPRPAPADFQVLWVAFFSMKARVATDDHLLFVLPDERLEDRVRDVRRVALPRHDEAEFVQEQAEFTADDPAPVRQPFTPILSRRAAFADGVNQFDTVRVNDAQDGRLGQKALSPGAVRLEQTEQARPLRQRREQRLEITRQPAIKGAVADAFDGEHQGQRDDLARVQRGLAVLRHLTHLVIYTAKEFGDKVFGGHDSSLHLRLVWSPTH